MPSSRRNNLRLLCDENIPQKFINKLLDLRFDAKKVPFGFSDQQVVMLAQREKRALITFDKHFSNSLLYDPQKYAGLIVLRIDPPLINTIINSWLALASLVSQKDLQGKLFILSPAGFRCFPKS
ncbi:MAG: DUF5615 family PIN-like protein [bacterium]|nr:DUF5615 family PIN-like protein [bacterium]